MSFKVGDVCLFCPNYMIKYEPREVKIRSVRSVSYIVVMPNGQEMLAFESELVMATELNKALS
jgi:hypothetical protein